MNQEFTERCQQMEMEYLRLAAEAENIMLELARTLMREDVNLLVFVTDGFGWYFEAEDGREFPEAMENYIEAWDNVFRLTSTEYELFRDGTLFVH